MTWIPAFFWPSLRFCKEGQGALSLSNKLGLNKRSKHIAWRYLFAQDIQATGLVNIQRVPSHNNPADIYTKCVTSPVLERHLRHNGIIELHMEEGEIHYFHILELAAQYINDFQDTDEELSYTKEQLRQMKDSNQYAREQRLRVQQKVNKQIKFLFNNKQKKDNEKLHLEKKRGEAAQQADIEHKQSQLLLQHQDLSH